ncbi:hypothetical protein OQA88_11147 [Cercophora sp. LCS_1]
MAASGLLGRGVPAQPQWLKYMRFAILGLSLIILALGAWAVAIFGNAFYYGYSGGAGGLVIFVCILSFIVFGGATAIEIWAPHLFFRIAFLIGYIFSVIFWLSGWAWSASTAAFWLTYSYGYGEATQEGAALAGCAGLGAVVWVMTIVNLVFFVKACLASDDSQQAELGNIKHYETGGYPAPGAQAYPPQAAYPQPGYPQAAYPAQGHPQ